MAWASEQWNGMPKWAWVAVFGAGGGVALYFWRLHKTNAAAAAQQNTLTPLPDLSAEYGSAYPGAGLLSPILIGTASPSGSMNPAPIAAPVLPVSPPPGATNTSPASSGTPSLPFPRLVPAGNGGYFVQVVDPVLARMYEKAGQTFYFQGPSGAMQPLTRSAAAPHLGAAGLGGTPEFVYSPGLPVGTAA